MMDTPPESERPIPGSEINPAKTVLIKIAGALILAVSGVITAFAVYLMYAFGGSAPISVRLFSLLREPIVWGFLLFAATGVGLILHARRRDTLYRKAWKERRRRA